MPDTSKKYVPPFTCSAPNLSPLHYVETEDLPEHGWVRITHTGEENVYFTDASGAAHYVKLG